LRKWTWSGDNVPVRRQCVNRGGHIGVACETIRRRIRLAFGSEMGWESDLDAVSACPKANRIK